MQQMQRQMALLMQQQQSTSASASQTTPLVDQSFIDDVNNGLGRAFAATAATPDLAAVVAEDGFSWADTASDADDD